VTESIPDVAALVAQLLARHPHARMVRDERRVVLVFQQIRVGVRVRTATTGGAPAVLLAAELGLAASIHPVEALEWNASLTSGMLAVVGHSLVLRSVLPMDGLSPEGLDRWLHALAAEAAEIKKRTVRPACNGAVFEVYCD
jgi:hypothetical protein